MHELTIRASNLTRRYGNLTAVNDLSIAVPPGSIYGFLGPNGAGKTTTIRMLLGLIHADGGEVQLFGLPFEPNRIPLLSRVGALVETPSMYPNLTGRENVDLTRRLRGLGKVQTDRALELVRLTKDANRRAGEYSLGMRQRLGLAMALVGEPELLILDEPTNGLDPSGIQEMRELIRGLPSETNATVFLSSHLLSEVEQIATHVGIVRGGSLVFEGPLERLNAIGQCHIALQVDRIDCARRLLSEAGWPVREDLPGQLHVASRERDAAAEINALLVAAGIKVYHLALEQPSLEDTFLKMTAVAEATN